MTISEFDFDNPEFYEQIYQFIMKGATYKECAYLLQQHFSIPITPDMFSKMKNGNFEGWSKAENERRSNLIIKEIDRASSILNTLVRGTYLSTALGRKKVHSVTKVTRKLRINGVYTDDEEIQTSETESEIAPNLNALGVWLYHHDKDWRKVQRGQDSDDKVVKAQSGIDIDSWIEKELGSAGI